ncbi:hypothetical protein ABZY32_17095, partial [Nocardiopsis alba]
VDDRTRPPGWKLSPWAVTRYLLGATLDDGTEPEARFGRGPRPTSTPAWPGTVFDSSTERPWSMNRVVRRRRAGGSR